MKQSISWSQLYDFLSVQNIHLTSRQKMQLEAYLDLIVRWSARHNLLSAKDLNHITERHILPSIYLGSLLSAYKDVNVLDIGSGAGFPGVVIKIIRPDLHVTLIDSARKKYLFLSEINENLNLSCQIVCDRAEKWLQETGQCFDLIVSRAVTTLEELWRWAERALRPNGAFYILKGGDLKSEHAGIVQLDAAASEIAPARDWCDFSAYLAEKIVVKMEKKNV